ncbi:hypothetical protein GCM10009548_10650 [Streptomyces malaysiensis subsp. malaysiensis]|uniref:Zf-HC2 domain-containing protein n=1 Tax=Streptomyces malaysiensis TaxID=92644 RepID=A0ABX6W7K3_STRMQ|nr:MULTISPECIES: hypothetical protein [Streptomyces]QPI57462.1 hypothetical protein I1A49_23375 [Streptomyces solisilvae]UHH19015.1 hypothetical protein LUV23_23560 [Streptomyces sp. HNM0561]
MTSSTDTDEHPEVAEISALTEGLLSPSRAVDVRTHLASCALCTDVWESLDEIRSLLGTLPGPVRMPAEIAGRIDAALAAEALLDATAPEGVADVSRETPEPEPVSRETADSTSSSSGSDTVQPASKTSTATDRPAGRPRGATGPGRGSTGPGTRPGGARRWRKVVLGGACAAAVIGIGSFFIPSGSSGDHGDADQQAHASQSSAGKSTLSSGTLKHRVHELLADRKSTASDGVTGQGNSPDVPLRADDDPEVPSCVQSGTGRKEPALAAQQDTYDGQTAYIVVLPHPSDSTRVDAFVIDASCVSASPSTPGELLVTRTYPRH